MKKKLLPGLLSLSMLVLSICTNAQAPTITWEDHFPRDYAIGNYTANDIKESPTGEGYVLVGSRSATWESNGYNQVMVMRVDKEAGFVQMNNIFTDSIRDQVLRGNELVWDTIPVDQVAYDMVFTKDFDVRYLITGYRDRTLIGADTPPGVFLMEIGGYGQVYVDTMYYNNNEHWIMGRCIQPAIGGGFIIAGSIAEDGGGTDKIMMITVKKNETGKYDVIGTPYIQVNQVGENGYASWIRQFGDGYLLGGTAYKDQVNKRDMFIQKVGEDRIEDWTMFYGKEEMEEFSDAVISGDTIYVVGSANVLRPDAAYPDYQIYVVKADFEGNIIWEKTYGGATRHFGTEIEMTADGNLMVAGSAYATPSQGQMVLLKIDAEKGDSLWMQDYGSYYSAGIRDMIRTSDFGYITTGRATYTASQDPRVHVMMLDYQQQASLFLAKEGLDLDINSDTPAKDVINVTADKVDFFGIWVKIDSLVHPSVGDLEISLEHAGTTVTLIDQPFHSGQNFLHTALIDAAEMPIESGFAPYTGWFRPEEPLLPFLAHEPTGEWTLTITDHGSGIKRSATQHLDGWSLNLLVESSGGGVGIPTEEAMMNFGLEQIRPNPLNQEALISFQIPKAEHVNLVVYNQLGQMVTMLVDEDLPAGVHERMWTPASLAPGTYFIHLEAGGLISVRKAMILK